MKNQLFCSVLMMSLAFASFGQGSSLNPYASDSSDSAELIGTVNIFFPSQQYSGVYDSIFGVEFQYRKWFSPPFGVAVSAGLMNADVSKDLKHIIAPETAVFRDSAQMIPIGVSGLYELFQQDNLRVDAELGLRYVLIDSSIKMDYVQSNESVQVNMDDALEAILRVNATYDLNEQFGLFTGFGVQVDLLPGDLTIPGVESSGNNLKGYSLTFGGKYMF